jgi:hypothetical protein
MTERTMCGETNPNVSQGRSGSRRTLVLHEHVLPTDLQTFSATRCGESCPLIKPLGGVEWLVAVMG